MHSIEYYFRDLTDPRSHINKKHNLLDIVFLVVAAMSAGAEGWKEIKDFGDIKLDWLRKFRPFENGIPVDDTIARVISKLDIEEVSKGLEDWFHHMGEQLGYRKPDNDSALLSNHIAIDGKYINGADRFLNMITAFATSTGLVMAQLSTEGKRNEIKAVQKFLNKIHIDGALITLDAAHCQVETASLIIARGADYSLQVKKNQKSLYQELEAFFHKTRRDEPELIIAGTFEELDCGHGRIEQRSYYQIPITTWVTTKKEWANLRSVTQVERIRDIKGKQTKEISYHISSLDVDPESAAKAIRGHWRIENSQHYVLDVTFKEDDIDITRGNAPENLAALRRLILNIFKVAKPKANNSMKSMLRCAMLSDDYRAKIIFGGFL